MEINITAILNIDAFKFSHSVVEGGENAGRETWAASYEEAKSRPLLTSEIELDAFRDYVKGFGAWTNEEIHAWTREEVNALFLQMIAADIREMGRDSLDEMTDDDWADPLTPRRPSPF